jgi:hypothetical protein
MTDTFDGLPALDADVTAVAIIDPDGNPNRVLDDQFPFDVTVDWTVSPPATAAVLDGEWTVNAYAESMGPGPEVLIGTSTVPATGVQAYSATMNVPAGTLTADVPPDSSGVYKLVIVITYRNDLGVLTELAGFSDGPLFMLRHP